MHRKQTRCPAAMNRVTHQLSVLPACPGSIHAVTLTRASTSLACGQELLPWLPARGEPQFLRGWAQCSCLPDRAPQATGLICFSPATAGPGCPEPSSALLGPLQPKSLLPSPSCLSGLSWREQCEGPCSLCPSVSDPQWHQPALTSFRPQPPIQAACSQLHRSQLRN